MSVHPSVPGARRWWQRLFPSGDERPHGLSEAWIVLDGPQPRTEVAVGPGGVFLLDFRRSRPRDVARRAGDLSGRLTTALGHCVTVHGVVVEEVERTLRADQPHGVTIVTEVVLGPWLESHPRAYDARDVRTLARAAGATGSPLTD
jgi:hypothetical protein